SRRSSILSGLNHREHVTGSVIEAVLLDALSVEPKADVSKLETKMLAELVALARNAGIVSEETASLSTVVRGYRNLIHPGVVKRKEKIIDQSGAIVVAELVEIIVKEVAKKKEATYGLTAEQVFRRVAGGSTALPIVAHLVRITNDLELQRLLISILPDTYFQQKASAPNCQSDLDHTCACFHSFFQASSEPVKAAVMRHIHWTYVNSDEQVVIDYEEHFLRAEGLGLLDQRERQFITDHLVPRFATVPDRLLRSAKGIVPYLSLEQTVPFSIAIAIVGTASHFKTHRTEARQLLVEECMLMSIEQKQITTLAFRTAYTSLEKSKDVEEMLEGWKELTASLALEVSAGLQALPTD
ncbi:MAG: hypothetical protein ABI811_12105, partial [Acidobacteriota bacterium]